MNLLTRISLVLLIISLTNIAPVQAQYAQTWVPQGLPPGYYYYFAPGDDKPSLHCVPHPYGYIPNAEDQTIWPMPVPGLDFYPPLTFAQLHRINRSSLQQIAFLQRRQAQLAKIRQNFSVYRPVANMQPVYQQQTPPLPVPPPANFRQDACSQPAYLPQPNTTIRHDSSPLFSTAPSRQPNAECTSVAGPDQKQDSKQLAILAPAATITHSPARNESARMKPSLFDDDAIMRTNKAANLVDRASDLMDSQNYKEACKTLIQAIKYDPNSNSGAAHYNLALSYEKTGSFKLAAAEYRNVLTFEPGNNDAAKAIGFCLERCGRVDEAISSLKQYLASNPHEPEVIGEIARCHRMKGNLQTAMHWYQRYLKSDPYAKDKKGIEALLKHMEETAIETAGDSPSDTDYFASATRIGKFRWPLEKLPLKVYIEDNKKVKNYRPYYREMMIEAFDAWTNASGKRVGWRLVTSKRKADIVCRWVADKTQLKMGKGFEGGLTLKNTKTTRGDEGIILDATITIVLSDLGGKPVEDIEIMRTCLHEVGHALGINGHSTNCRDIMFFSDSIAKTGTLTRRDMVTIMRLYGRYPSQFFKRQS